MTRQKKCQPHKASQKKSRFNEASRNAQNARLVAHFSHEQADTFTIIHELNICRAGARASDPRSSGYEIIITRTELTNEWGRIHKGVAIYTLISEPGQQVAA